VQVGRHHNTPNHIVPIIGRAPTCHTGAPYRGRLWQTHAGRRRSPRTLVTTAAVRTAQGRVNSSGEAQRVRSRPGHTAAPLWQTRTQAIAQPRSLSVRACRRSTRRRRLGCPCSLRAGRRCRTAARAGAWLHGLADNAHRSARSMQRAWEKALWCMVSTMVRGAVWCVTSCAVCRVAR
jgi:hypothetical protein